MKRTKESIKDDIQAQDIANADVEKISILEDILEVLQAIEIKTRK